MPKKSSRRPPKKSTITQTVVHPDAAGIDLASEVHYVAVPADRPIHYQQMFATLYRHLGIDPAQTTVPDPNHRPQYLLEHADAIRELG